jgi:hypothetical protein
MYCPTSAVRHVEVDCLRVVLDLNSETYKVLDDGASAMWAVLTGESTADSAFKKLAEIYDLDEGRFRADLLAFADRCAREGLLETSEGAATPSAAAGLVHLRGIRPTTLRALACLISTRWCLAVSGFRKTYESYADLMSGAERAALEPALTAFVRAENFYIARRAPNDCLLRSLSLYRLLRLSNVPAEHVIGVRRFPFAVHAWVECDGIPLLDDRAIAFTELARLGPRRDESTQK